MFLKCSRPPPQAGEQGPAEDEGNATTFNNNSCLRAALWLHSYVLTLFVCQGPATKVMKLKSLFFADYSSSSGGESEGTCRTPVFVSFVYSLRDFFQRCFQHLPGTNIDHNDKDLSFLILL